LGAVLQVDYSLLKDIRLLFVKGRWPSREKRADENSSSQWELRGPAAWASWQESTKKKRGPKGLNSIGTWKSMSSVGYGGAGAAAAITASDAGANVLILEKTGGGGGSTYFSGGFFVSPRDVNGAVAYLLGCAKAADA
jgi:hypothetical protein